MIRCLDLFCGGGGAASGYIAAGFSVTGVDIRNTENYPGNFVCGDAIAYASVHAQSFDFIHASPPCQAYSAHVTSVDSKWNHTRGKNEPALIATVREILISSGVPFVIENVMGARNEMPNADVFCGTMFNLPISRHRLIEAHGFLLSVPMHPKCRGVAKVYAAANGIDYRDMSVTGKGRRAGCADRWRAIMGISHVMTQHEIAESIPPAYTKYIGEQFLKEAWR